MNLKTTKQLMVIVTVIVIMTGCAEMLRSDSANAFHNNARAHREALIGNQTASSQAAPAQTVGDEAVRRMLSGNSHVSEYRKAVADAKPYFTTYKYFGPDGIYISRDTYSRRTDTYEAVGRWQIKQNLLCVNERNETEDPRCYTLKVTANGVIQYWIHKPGDPFHGLITSNIEIVRPGLQTPEYVTTQSPYQR